MTPCFNWYCTNRAHCFFGSWYRLLELANYGHSAEPLANTFGDLFFDVSWLLASFLKTSASAKHQCKFVELEFDRIALCADQPARLLWRNLGVNWSVPLRLPEAYPQSCYHGCRWWMCPFFRAFCCIVECCSIPQMPLNCSNNWLCLSDLTCWHRRYGN